MLDFDFPDFAELVDLVLLDPAPDFSLSLSVLSVLSVLLELLLYELPYPQPCAETMLD